MYNVIPSWLFAVKQASLQTSFQMPQYEKYHLQRTQAR